MLSACLRYLPTRSVPRVVLSRPLHAVSAVSLACLSDKLLSLASHSRVARQEASDSRPLIYRSLEPPVVLGSLLYHTLITGRSTNSARTRLYHVLYPTSVVLVLAYHTPVIF